MLNAPIGGGEGTSIDTTIGGWDPDSTVTVTMYSTLKELGRFTANADGIVHARLVLPAATPGVHTIEWSKNTPAGVSLHKQVRVSYAGRPVGDSDYAARARRVTVKGQDEVLSAADAEPPTAQNGATDMGRTKRWAPGRRERSVRGRTM